MNNNVRGISLASLAVSVGAAALLGVSNVASADDPWFCMELWPCTTRPEDDPSGSYWSHGGNCMYGGYEMYPYTLNCACVAEFGMNPQTSWPWVAISHFDQECYGGD